jgi:hypothetical protein
VDPDFTGDLPRALSKIATTIQVFLEDDSTRRVVWAFGLRERR